MKMRTLYRCGGFMLLEVLLSMVILSVMLTALLRAFILSNNSMREAKIVATASYLAETMLEDYELEPPLDGNEEGTFAEDKRFGEDYQAYSWERRVEEIEPRYREMPRGMQRDIETMMEIRLRIIYDDGKTRRFVPMDVTTYLLDSQLFTDDALRTNQLY